MGRAARSAVVAWAALVAATSLPSCSGTEVSDPVAGSVASPIIGGNPATKEQRTATIALLETQTGQVFCSGALIAPTVVATAAHCVALESPGTHAIRLRAPRDVIVVAGALDAASARPEERFAIASLVCHPGYPGPAYSSDPEGLGEENDLCLLLLKDPISTLPITEVPPRRMVEGLVHAGTLVTIEGYGVRDLKGTLFGQLYTAQTPFVRATAAEFLAGETGAPDSCRGDSGGPVYVSDGSKTYLLGTASRQKASATALCGEGGIYTLLPSYTSWMHDASAGAYTAVPDTEEPAAGGGCSVRREPRAPCSELLLGFGLALLVARRRRAG